MEKLYILIGGAVLGILIGWSLHRYRNRHRYSINYKLNHIMSQISDLKDKVSAQGTALDTITGSVTGIQTDVAALKQMIADLQTGNGGATAAEIAELSTLVDTVGAKIDEIGTTTASLDAETP